MKTVRGALARGCRPTKISFNGEAASEERILAFLNSLDGADSIRSVYLDLDTEPSDAVARAVARAIPNLSDTSFQCRAPSCRGAQQGDTAAGGGHQLLQLVGPKLKRLSLCLYGAPADALAECTALTSLHLHAGLDAGGNESGLAAETSMFRTLSSLTGLQGLSISGGAQPPLSAAVRQARAASLESCLSSLTALTSLRLGLHCLKHAPHPDPETSKLNGDVDVAELASQLRSTEGRAEEADRLLSAVAAESRALGAAVRCMPQLRELRTQARIYAADLAPLTVLTYLRVGAIVLPPPPAPGEAAATQGNEPQQQQQQPMYDLPPQLKVLKVYAPLSVHVAAALQRSTAAASAGVPLISWRAPGMLPYDGPYWALAFGANDLDDQGRLTVEAVAAMHRAVNNLRAAFKLKISAPGSRLGERGLHLQFFGIQEVPDVLPPAPAVGTADGTHCGSWLGAAVAKLRPQRLRLWGFEFSAHDMLSLSRCLSGLKELDLRGSGYSMSSLPLLGSLGALEVLKLSYDDWDWEPQEDETDAMVATFLALTAPADRTDRWMDEDAAAGGNVEALYECRAALPLPSLQQLDVYCEDGDTVEGLREALAAAAAELRRRRPKPAVLFVRAE